MSKDKNNKVKEGAILFGMGIGTIAMVILYVAISLAVTYFGIKITLAVGDHFFGKDEPTAETRLSSRKDTPFFKSCKEGGGSDAVCSCAYSGVAAKFTSKELEKIADTGYSDSQKVVLADIFNNCNKDTKFYD